MKLRIHGNSIRLRLNRTEVAQFDYAGRVEEAIEFPVVPKRRLTYALEKAPGLSNIGIKYEHDDIRVLLPENLAKDWITTDRVGVDGEQFLEGGTRLTIVVEKDFKCLHGPESENVDAYPNPLQCG